MNVATKFVVIGGAGFIGAHAVTKLLANDAVTEVTVYDNFSSGRDVHLLEHEGDERLKVVRADVKKIDLLTEAMEGSDAVIHLASNPDISRAVTEPDIDFWEGTFLTNNVVEAMRRAGVRKLLYASGSGVYGDLGFHEAEEDLGPLIPTSTYGASKLAGEALISSYAHMFDMQGRAFRFGNVVGPRQTHGVGYDFVRRLLKNPNYLEILGDGEQSKSYIHVDDVLEAVFLAFSEVAAPFNVFNVATGDYITVTEIADLAAQAVGLDPDAVEYRYSGGDRGWKGDVPIVRLSTERVKKLGWSCQRSCREALSASLASMVEDMRAGHI